PRWPGGKISALGPEGYKFETRFHLRTAVQAGLVHVKSVGAKSPSTGVVRKFGEGCQLWCPLHHLTAVQNDEVRPKIALVLLRNGT
ncbi:hypothetical protein AVEN_163535-2-1, partial [Araneus ventricosus]